MDAEILPQSARRSYTDLCACCAKTLVHPVVKKLQTTGSSNNHYLNTMLHFFLKCYWKLTGWKAAANFPHHIKKMVIIVAPHTSWIDLVVGLAARQHLKIQHARFFGKKELFFWPLGSILRSRGGIPVGRFSPHGVVGQAVSLFAESENFTLVLAPEGTRKKVDKLRSGFYHIAKKAGVPILTAGLDYEHKQVIIGELLFTTADEDRDMRKLLDFFTNIKGKKPERDLRHLKETV